MKKIFTFAFAMAAAYAANAQAPADWQIDQNVAAELGFGDVDGLSFSGEVGPNDDTNRPHDKVVKTLGDYWKVDGDLPNEFLESYDGNIGIYGFYDKKTADMYQVAKFPAGSYEIKVQALYREGTPADNFTNHFNKKYMKYGHLYADVLSSEDPNSTVTRNFDKVLCSLATSGQNEEVYYFGDGSWMNDYKYEYKDKETGEITNYYCPQCLDGLSKYFALEKYYNTMKVVISEDSYIRLGFRKTGSITADWLVFTNLQVIYKGPADEKAKVALAKEEVTAAISNLEDIQNDVISAGFEGLAGAIGDLVMDAQDARDGATDVETLVALNTKVNKNIDDYGTSLQFVKNLSDLLNQCDAMISSTEFPGFNEFKAAYESADAAAKTSDIDALGDNPGDYYQKVYNELATARATYLNSQDADENGAKDFTSLVKNPWFVNPEYTPNHNDDGTWTLSEETWQWGNVGNPDSYAKAKNNRTDISSEVVLYPSDDVTNQWYKKNAYTGWSAGLALYYQAGLIAVSDGWNSLASGTIGIEQQLVGLPAGYYSLKALVRGNNGDAAWDGKNREVFAQNSNGEIVVSETVKNDSDRPNSKQNGWYEWNPNAWADVKTSVIPALDGKLLIGGRCSKVASYTGFRLLFYGAEINPDNMIQEDIDKVVPTIEDLQFAGDKKAAQDMLNEVYALRPIPSIDVYQTALDKIADVRNYISVAKAGENNYKAIDKFAALADYDFVTPASEFALSYGNNEADTYERVDEINEIANVYTTYCDVYKKAVELNDANVNAIIAKQTAEMKEAMKTADEVGAYLDALAVPYNIAILASKGAADATEANPANLTSLIINPDFTNEPAKGWSGETPTNNEFSYDTNGNRVNAELWNKSAFTLSQKLVGLPAGTYELRVKAIYRDGGSVTAALVDAYNEAGNEEAWANHNAQLFAKASDENDQFTYIKAIESLKYTENSFVEVAKGYDSDEDENGTMVTFPTSAVAIEGTAHSFERATYDNDAKEGAYPFDTKIGDYYYPASMQGFLQVCAKHPEDVTNKVQITINSGDDLEIGIRKTTAIGSDWVIFDDFELYYLSGDTFKEVQTGIETISSVKANGAIYNVAGQRVAENYKGIVIKNGKKYLNK